MTSCPDKPECPYRVVIAEYLIDEIRFAESPEDAAEAAAEEHELDALLDPISVRVAEVPCGKPRRYLLRAYPVMVYEAEAEAEAEPCRICSETACVDDAHGRRASVESDPLAALLRPCGDTPDGAP